MNRSQTTRSDQKLKRITDAVMAKPEPCSKPDAGSQMHVVWQWFRSWEKAQRTIFLEKLVPRVTPHKLFAMTERMGVQSVAAPTSWEHCLTFEQQVAFFHGCLDGWSADEANTFLQGLEEMDELAVNEFYAKVASTVQEP